MFFAPSQIQKRHREWGAAEYQRRLGEAWQAFLGEVDDWVTIVESSTPDQLEEVYSIVLNGAAPDKAYVLRTAPREGLKALIEREGARRLAALRGSEKQLQPVSRRRPDKR
jgi:formylmethanofuran:tetrahydromethanopterin formyltransferase